MNWAVQFIGTPQFQRLKEIKQLGATYFVFPGASHNRFEHSLGTAHLAYTFAKTLMQQGAEGTENDLKCVTLAALCHDLGLDKKWKHENGSVTMLGHLIEELRESESVSFNLETEDEKFIEALILGESVGFDRPKYLFDIVNNKNNSVGVDKFDYISRDFDRIVTNLNVDRAINYMIADALVKANPYLKIKEAIDKPKEYDLEDSKNIIKRIRRRDLYKFVAECLISKDHKKFVTKWLELNYGRGDKNPVEKVTFYDKNNRNETFKIAREDIGYLVPEQFEEIVLRIFVRESNEEQIQLIKDSFENRQKVRKHHIASFEAEFNDM
ncbi:4942_t:CDS:10 [Dentiscutata erythropus]|uniref:4942_t:CDS:1 n=1 Tax=Dentiscutata erythropus TaxID=1348616 RepID=A0A9N9HXX0_9GLOM|nr:4942_t:CDS:10 [Dentiscutata erythropus]